MDGDPILQIKKLKEDIEQLKTKLESSEAVKHGEIGMNQALKVQIQKQQEYINELSKLNDKYINKIAKAKGDLQFFLERN
tara:strand:+ start:643 stop:882 length:240 start_codon:yes stop_codon:yes gene_type:complete